MLLRWIPLLLPLSLLNACGQTRIVEIKEFKLFVDSDQNALHDAIDKLMVRYNAEYGAQVLSVVETQAESNSIIRFDPNLREDGNKLGTGQWITTTSMGKTNSIEGEIRTTRIEYGMEVAFDENNFLSKFEKLKEGDKEVTQHLYHLFCHEIGHGMQLDHSDDRNNVMYPTIPEKANRVIEFNNYFRQIRTFITTKTTQQENKGPRWAQ